MQSGGWIALLRLIPAAQHHNLVLTTVNGIELAVQAVIRIEPDYIVIRGRRTGVTDGGGYFFVPYDQIQFLGFQKAVKETTIRGMYGETCPSEAKETPVVDEAPAPEAEPAAPPTPEPVPGRPPSGVIPPPNLPGAPVPGPARPTNTSKAALLERLRARKSDPGSGSKP